MWSSTVPFSNALTTNSFLLIVFLFCHPGPVASYLYPKRYEMMAIRT